MRSLVSFIAIVLISQSCKSIPSFDCNDEIKVESKSPEGKYTATLYERDCGATTDFSTIVSLRSSSNKFSGEEGRIFVIKGRPQIKITWRESISLQVECDDCRTENIFKQDTSWNEIAISYRLP
jgi:hypothetical protein